LIKCRLFGNHAIRKQIGGSGCRVSYSGISCWGMFRMVGRMRLECWQRQMWRADIGRWIGGGSARWPWSWNYYHSATAERRGRSRWSIRWLILTLFKGQVAFCYATHDVERGNSGSSWQLQIRMTIIACWRRRGEHPFAATRTSKLTLALDRIVNWKARRAVFKLPALLLGLD